jgi:hypothetical protein
MCYGVLSNVPEGTLATTDTEAVMPPAACAIVYVNVWNALGLVGLARIPRFHFVVLGVAAAMGNLLVLLQLLEILQRQHMAELGHGVTLAGKRMRRWASRSLLLREPSSNGLNQS